MLRQTGPIRISALTGWEAPDPVWWTARGYAVVNADLREREPRTASGRCCPTRRVRTSATSSSGPAAQPWSTGAVGLIGVSYLALSQWKAAALQPPSLRAIVPWEGFTNAYRDLVRPGGIAEIGFVRIWSWASSGPGCATPSVPPPGTDHCATNGGSSSFPSCAGSPCPR